MDSPSLQIDGFGPLPVRRPKTVVELGECVRQARSQNQAIYPVGGRTHLSLGLPPNRAGIAVETVGVNQVIDYPARDLTITVQAGIRVQDLQTILAKENQRLAVDIARADLATLGGALAVNASGPRRYGCGTLRDYLIGVSFVNDDGNEIKSGGRVVKNVAGYDMCKLLVGSLGTLGIITQATLKLRPLPETRAAVIVRFGIEKIDAVLALIHGSQTRPCCIELLDPFAARAAGMPGSDRAWQVLVGFEENQQAVEWQARTLGQELHAGSFANVETIDGQAKGSVWQELTESGVTSDPVFRIRASVPAQMLGELCRLVAEREQPWRLQAHAGNGILRIQGSTEYGEPRSRELFVAVLDFAAKNGGNAVVEDCPSEWKRGLEIWGRPREDLWLMRKIKDSLDPDHIFNPGRFVAGI